MNDEQYKRYRKIISDKKIQILFNKIENGNIHYLIQGSIKYKVSIYKTGKVICSCPDYKYSNAVNKCYCKHILFIFNPIFDINHSIYTRTFITPDEILYLLKFIKKI